MSFIAPVITEIQPKLSQKERRRLQRVGKQPEQGAVGTIPSAAPLVSAVCSPWKISNTPTPAANDDSPFAIYKNGDDAVRAKPKKPTETYQPTLADIIRQEQRDVREQERAASKTLKEIQQEEEFNKWWTAESKREIERQQAAEASTTPRPQSNRSRRSRGARRGGQEKHGMSKPRDNKVAVNSS
jgi:hypothetical protein